MTADYQINLSSGELYALAGLLRFNCLYGIENKTATKWQPDLQRHIRQMVKRLESRKLILFELHGRLLIVRQLYMIMKLLCQPERIVAVSGSARNRKKAAMYILEKEGIGATISRFDEDNYKIVMYSSGDVIALLRKYFRNADNAAIHEKILLEDVQYIQEQIASFQPDAAKAHLCKCVKDQEHMDFLYGIFDKTNDYTEARFMKRKNEFYETQYNLVISSNQSQAVLVNADENDVLSIDSFHKRFIDERISEFFAIPEKRSTL